jgi:hypothetical protein
MQLITSFSLVIALLQASVLATAQRTKCGSDTECVLELTPNACGANANSITPIDGYAGVFHGGNGACRHRNDTLPADFSSVSYIVEPRFFHLYLTNLSCAFVTDIMII